MPLQAKTKSGEDDYSDVTWENKKMPYSLFMQERVCTSDAFVVRI